MKEKSAQFLENFPVEQFRTDLIDWFSEEQRDLPWRKSRDPYKVWVSEIMLQQTRVDTVIPYYLNFIDKFPTVESLATADEDKVLKAWEGLGYYSRVRNLQSAVREVHETYGGVVPNTKDEISKLKGVGPYTTGAVLSIAYGVPEPAVDGNVMRVLSRILLVEEDIAKVSTRKLFEEMIRVLIDQDNPSYFNQGLMELGALICIPNGKPSCLLCPVREHCRAYHEGNQDQLPVKTKKVSQKEQSLAVVIIRDEAGRYLIQKRPSDGLLANLWQFPMVEMGSNKADINKKLKKETGLAVKVVQPFGNVHHIFSHLVWRITGYTSEFINSENIELKEGFRLVTEAELVDFAFPVPFQKMWKQFKEYQHS